MFRIHNVRNIFYITVIGKFIQHSRHIAEIYSMKSPILKVDFNLLFPRPLLSLITIKTPAGGYYDDIGFVYFHPIHITLSGVLSVTIHNQRRVNVISSTIMTNVTSLFRLHYNNNIIRNNWIDFKPYSRFPLNCQVKPSSKRVSAKYTII